VLCAGGVDPTHPVERDQRQMEVFSPPYLDMGPRPTLTSVPATGSYGDTITLDTPDAADVATVVLIRPNSVTHHTDAGHRLIRVPIVGTAASSVDVQLPATPTVAPPGHYMVFILNGTGVPSEASFIHIS
jgi:Domain of unknown function (DUF1929)